MNQLSMWQMIVDLGLVSSILFMAFRSAKSTRVQALIPQIAELETRVMKLIGEAEAAAKGVHDQLLRREQNLTKSLTELTERQKEISSSVIEGESLTKELSLLCESARRETQELSRTIADAGRRQAEADRAYERAQRESEKTRAAAIDAERNFKEERVPFTTRAPSRRASEWLEDGEEERAIENSPQPERPSLNRLNELYQAAEEMLKNGRKPKEVSDRTRIPVEGVERLAQMIEIEREEREQKRRTGVMTAGGDSRLGVLGVSRRITPTP